MYSETINIQNFNVSVFIRKGLFSVYIYNKYFFCFLKFSKIFTIKLKNNNTLEVINYVTDNNYQIQQYIKQFYLNEFTKIKFTGKGYKIKKNSNKSIILLFNRAHITILWWNNIIIRKLKKYKFYLKYNIVNKELISKILKIRYINIFTKKGLRQSRQILLKKKGKK